jgi:uncharacterized protein (TIGR03086 family)
MDLLDALELASTDFAARAAAIGDDQWTLPSPCEGWDVREVLRHVTGGSIMTSVLLAGGSRDDATAVFAGEPLGDDPVASCRAALEREVEAFRANPDPDRVLPHPAMDMPASMLLVFRVIDVAVHGWDVSRAIGADEALDPELVAVAWEHTSPMGPMLPSTGMFGSGASGTVPDDAPLQLRLLDLLGRRP